MAPFFVVVIVPPPFCSPRLHFLRRGGLLSGRPGSRSVFSAEDDVAGGTFVHRVLSFFRRSVFFKIQSGQEVFRCEQITVSAAHPAADAPDLTKCACVLAIFFAVACNRHHNILRKRNHLDQFPRTPRGTRPAAGAFIIIHHGQPVDDMQRVKLTAANAAAISQTAVGARLHIRLGVGTGATDDAFIF